MSGHVSPTVRIGLEVGLGSPSSGLAWDSGSVTPRNLRPCGPAGDVINFCACITLPSGAYTSGLVVPKLPWLDGRIQVAKVEFSPAAVTDLLSNRGVHMLRWALWSDSRLLRTYRAG